MVLGVRSSAGLTKISILSHYFVTLCIVLCHSIVTLGSLATISPCSSTTTTRLTALGVLCHSPAGVPEQYRRHPPHQTPEQHAEWYLPPYSPAGVHSPCDSNHPYLIRTCHTLAMALMFLFHRLLIILFANRAICKKWRQGFGFFGQFAQDDKNCALLSGLTWNMVNTLIINTGGQILGSCELCELEHCVVI